MHAYTCTHTHVHTYMHAHNTRTHTSASLFESELDPDPLDWASGTEGLERFAEVSKEECVSYRSRARPHIRTQTSVKTGEKKKCAIFLFLFDDASKSETIKVNISGH